MLRTTSKRTFMDAAHHVQAVDHVWGGVGQVGGDGAPVSRQAMSVHTTATPARHWRD